MTKKHLLTSIIAFVIIALSASIFTFAYFYQKDLREKEGTIGLVDVKADIYFDDNGVRNEATPIEINQSVSKEKVYYVNVSNLNSIHHINKLRVDFKIKSNVETYFRFKLIDTLTLVIETDAGQRELSVPNEGIEYKLDNESNWYLDQTSSWYYYKNRVIKDGNELTIPFIIEGLAYDLRPQQYKIQLGIKIEAVQAERGPEMNWDLVTPPWKEEGDDW